MVWANQSLMYLFAATQPVHKLDDLKGLLVRSPGAYVDKFLKDNGASTVVLTTSDVYMALQRKTAQATYMLTLKRAAAGICPAARSREMPC
jgi:TRAP-type C4-dicarboxylate transport system substrate-binding protein